jgi:hypothetical protein
VPRGRGRGGFGIGYGRGFGIGYGRGLGFNPYSFCRVFPWLPRWWWANPQYQNSMYFTSQSPSYPTYRYNTPAFSYPQYTPQSLIQERNYLEQQLISLQNTLQQIKQRLNQLQDI